MFCIKLLMNLGFGFEFARSPWPKSFSASSRRSGNFCGIYKTVPLHLLYNTKYK